MDPRYLSRSFAAQGAVPSFIEGLNNQLNRPRIPANLASNHVWMLYHLTGDFNEPKISRLRCVETLRPYKLDKLNTAAIRRGRLSADLHENGANTRTKKATIMTRMKTKSMRTQKNRRTRLRPLRNMSKPQVFRLLLQCQ